MEKVQTQQAGFETVWAILQEVGKKQKENAIQLDKLRESQRETDRQMKERMEETDRQMKERAEKTDRQMKERMEETDRQMKETGRRIDEYNKRFGEFTRRFGEIVEYMIAPNLQEKFMELNLVFPKANNNTRVKDHINNIHFEIDVMLENGEKAMLVEIKTKLTTENVKDHINRLEKMRTYADLHGDKRTFLGAAAGVVMDAQTKNYALKQGFFVIEPSGETFNITPPQDLHGKTCAPKEW